MFRKSVHLLPIIRNVQYHPSLASSQRDFHSPIEVRKDIRKALKRKEPVVALESTIITHGMPYPTNFETASLVEEEVIHNGALPATIAIIDGIIKVGLQRHELKKLASVANNEVYKCSRRDIPYLVANKKSGGTTVAATMIIAEMCGIKVFATGGIGGVHRDGHITMDISADLIELGRTPITVISSGVKSILDIERSLEYLETQGVCVATYGDANGRFPDFFTPDSGFKVSYNCETPKDAANLINALNDLKLKSGILIAVPIPSSHAANKERLDEAIESAIRHAAISGIFGKDVTPHVLKAVNEATGGESLEANKVLIQNNAKVAAQIACELCSTTYRHRNNEDIPVPTIIGGSILDISMTLKNQENFELNGATYQVNSKQSAGGVGRNLAEGLFKLYGDANFISAIGSDHIGKSLLSFMPEQLRACVHIDEKKSTSLCTLMFDALGECKLLLGNMEIHETISPEILQKHEELLIKSPLLIIDANLSLATIEKTLNIAGMNEIPVFFEPTDMLIASKPFFLPRELTKVIKIISPNIYELLGIAQTLTSNELKWESNPTLWDTEKLLEETKPIMKLIADDFDCIILTLGHHGILISIQEEHRNGLYTKDGDYIPKSTDWNKPLMIFYPAPKVENIINVSGAGDSFNCGFISELLNGSNIDKCVAMGFVACQKALQSESAVPKAYFKSNDEKSKMLENAITNLESVKI